MKNKWLMCAIGILALGAASGSYAQSSEANEKAAIAAETQWLESEKTNNADMAAGLFAEKYVATGADGTLEDKAQTLADAKSRKFTSSAYEDVKAHAYGDTVIVTGGWSGKGTEASGKPFSEHFRWTDTWIKMPDGKFQVVASHYSWIKPKK